MATTSSSGGATAAATATSHQVSTPLMGGLDRSSKTATPWTGGAPKFDWSGLNSSSPNVFSSPNLLRPVEASASQKAYNYRKEGLSTKFQSSSDLHSFKQQVWEHLRDCGLDTITYLPDPEDPSTVSSVIQAHSRYTVDLGTTLSNILHASFDSYDKINDKVVTTFLMNSQDVSLRNDLEDRKKASDPFTVVWLRLLHLITSTSVDKFETIKQRIKGTTPSSFLGENLQEIGSSLRKNARELKIAGQYDHNLTLHMLDNFVCAGGEDNEDYRFELRTTKRDLNKALLEIVYKSKTDARKYMVTKKLTHTDICEIAEGLYRNQIDNSKWSPAKTPRDKGAPQSLFGNFVTGTSSQVVTKAEVLNLIKSNTPASSRPPPKTGNCHHCGQPGHWRNQCPLLKRERSNQGRFNGRRGGNGNSRNHGPQSSSRESVSRQRNFRYIPPADGESQVKLVSGKTFNCCAKYKRWTTTHTTATHIGTSQASRNTTPSANAASSDDSHLQISDPSAWLFDVPSTFGFESFAPLVWFFIAYGLTCLWNCSEIWFPPFTEWIFRFLASVCNGEVVWLVPLL